MSVWAKFGPWARVWHTFTIFPNRPQSLCIYQLWFVESLLRTKETKEYLRCLSCFPPGLVSSADPQNRPAPSGFHCRSCSRRASSLGTSFWLNTREQRVARVKVEDFKYIYTVYSYLGRRKKNKPAVLKPCWSHRKRKHKTKKNWSLCSLAWDVGQWNKKKTKGASRIHTLLMKTLIPSWKILCRVAA